MWHRYSSAASCSISGSAREQALWQCLWGQRAHIVESFAAGASTFACASLGDATAASLRVLPVFVLKVHRPVGGSSAEELALLQGMVCAVT